MNRVIFKREDASVYPSPQQKNHILMDSNRETIGIISGKLTEEEALGHVAWLKGVYDRGVRYGEWKAKQDMQKCLGIDDE